MEKTLTLNEVPVTMLLNAWQGQNKSLNQLLTELSDEQLEKEIAPGKNTGVYLLGHLVAVHDNMFSLLGFGEKLFPELENVFLANPDKSGVEKPATATLREYLEAVSTRLNNHIRALSPAEWFERHTAVSAEAFEKEPHRNKLNIIVSRTNHLAYHLGQLILLK